MNARAVGSGIEGFLGALVLVVGGLLTGCSSETSEGDGRQPETRPDAAAPSPDATAPSPDATAPPPDAPPPDATAPPPDAPPPDAPSLDCTASHPDGHGKVIPGCPCTLTDYDGTCCIGGGGENGHLCEDGIWSGLVSDVCHFFPLEAGAPDPSKEFPDCTDRCSREYGLIEGCACRGTEPVYCCPESFGGRNATCSGGVWTFAETETCSDPGGDVWCVKAAD